MGGTRLCRSSKSLTSRRGFQQHIQHHTSQYSYSCKICRKGFSSNTHYKLHVRGHEGRGFSCEKVYKCKSITSLNILEFSGLLARHVAKDAILEKQLLGHQQQCKAAYCNFNTLGGIILSIFKYKHWWRIIMYKLIGLKASEQLVLETDNSLELGTQEKLFTRVFRIFSACFCSVRKFKQNFDDNR